VIDNRKVVAWTPYGRRQTYSLLVQYLRRDVEHGLVDEVWAYMNTDPTGQEEDIAYAHELDALYPWFHLKYRPDGMDRHPGPKQRNTGYAYRHMADPDAVYLRFDDDIVYIHESAVENLVRARLEMPLPVAVFATTWNNAIVSWFAQQAGVIPREFGTVGGPYCMDPTGWANGQFAVSIHELLLEKIESGRVEDLFLYQDFPVQNPQGGAGMQFSVSCFASLGSMYAGLPTGPGVLVPDEEESWHTMHQPPVVGQPNMLVGNALVSHFTFMPQRPHVLASNILGRYRTLAEKLEV
jgi:hypothetical protein